MAGAADVPYLDCMPKLALPSILVLVAFAATYVPAAAAADSPSAHQAIQCGDISTSNGGVVRYINTYRMTCKTARQIARKAKGKKYTALDSNYTCVPKKSSGISGLGYFCKNSGKTRTLGFLYYSP